MYLNQYQFWFLNCPRIYPGSQEAHERALAQNSMHPESKKSRNMGKLKLLFMCLSQ